jgi:hypothetical protein
MAFQLSSGVWSSDVCSSVLVVSSSDGITFGGKVTLGESSYAAPALAGSSSMILLAWTGMDNARSLNVISSSDGIAFGGKATLGESSSAAPALAGSATGFSLAWTGTDSAHSLNIIRALGGAKETLPDTSNLAPALTLFNGQLALAWTGMDSASHLNVRSFDLTGGQTSQNTFTWQWPTVTASSAGQICLPIVGCIQMWTVNQTQGFPTDLADGVPRLGVQAARLTSGSLPDGLNLNLNLSGRSATLSGNVSGNIALNLVYDLLNGSGGKVGTLTVLINILSGGGSPGPQPPPPGGTCNPCTLSFEGMIQGAGGILTIVSGVTIAVNGVARTTPFTISAAAGTPLTLQAQASLTLSGVTYQFSQWRSSVTGFLSNQNPMTGTVDRNETIQAVYAQGGSSGGTISLAVRAVNQNNNTMLSVQIAASCCGGSVTTPTTLTLSSGSSLTLTAPAQLSYGAAGLDFQYWAECFGFDCLAWSDPTLHLDNLTMSGEVRAVYK